MSIVTEIVVCDVCGAGEHPETEIVAVVVGGVVVAERCSDHAEILPKAV